MAIFHLSQQLIGRSSGKSAIAASAYRACTRLVEKSVDKVTGLAKKIVHDYRNKKGLEYSVILAPEHVKKDSWVYDRQKLWSGVQDCEVRKDAQFCREFNIALPIELSREENKELILSYVSEVFVSRGMVADVSMHYDNPENPHAHVMLTTRDLVIKGGGVKFGFKNRDWNDRKFLIGSRELWADYVNQELRVRGFEERVTHKSFKELGINIMPTVHEGPSRHITNSKLSLLNQDIIRRNAVAIIEEPDIVIDTINKTTFSKADLEAKVLEYLRFDTDSDHEIMAGKFVYCMERVLSSNKLIRLEGFKKQEIFASLSRVDKERSFIDVLKSLNSKSNHTIDVGVISGLSEEQKSVVVGVCSGQDISIIEGLPGSGKTTLLREIVKQYRDNGYKVFGTSTSSIATRNLSTVANIDSHTIAKWKWNNKLSTSGIDDKTLFIVDEMSMVDFESFHMLLDTFNGASCKVVLLGDTNQFGAIGIRGAATKAVEICGSLQLREVQRHKNELHRKATRCLGEYKVGEAFDIYSSSGALRVFEKNAKEQLVLDYVDDYTKHTDQRHIILGYKNDTVNELNLMIRNKLIEQKIIDNGVNVGKLNLSKGDRIIFCRNERSIDVLNGEEGIVLSADKNGNISVMVDDRTINFNIKDYEDFKHGYAITCYKSQGTTYDTVKVIYEPIMNYETFNVMMTRHKSDVGFYCNRSDLMDKVSTTDRLHCRTSDLELVKGKLETKFSTKTSNLLSLDFLDDKCQKIRDYIEVKNMIRLYVKSDLNINHDTAKKYLEMLDKRNVIASEINNNIHDYKDYLGLVGVSMSEIQNNIKVKNKFMSSRAEKEQALEIESKIVLKQHEYDYVIALRKHSSIVTTVCAKDFVKVFELFKDKSAAENKFRDLYFNSTDKIQALVEIKNDPTILGSVRGFELFGFQSSTRKDALKTIDNYFENHITKDENQAELRAYSSLETITQEINELQKSLGKILAEQQEVKQVKSNTVQRSKTERTFIRYDDVKLSKSDYEELFKKYIGYINQKDQPKKFGNELKCGSLTMDLENGLWIRFASNDKGNIYQFVEYATGCGKREALEIVARHAGLQITDNVVWDTKEYVKDYNKNNQDNKWQKLDKIPENITLEPEKDLSWMKQTISATYEYRDVDNNVLGYTVRCEQNGKKQILPIVLCTNGEKTQWMSKGFGNHLYGIEKIKQNSKDIIIVEGEKTADAAQQLLPEYTVIAFAGTNKLESVDFTSLKGRNAIVWPDNDSAGITAANKVTEQLKSHNVSHRIVDTKHLPEKWDLADKLPISLDKIKSMIQTDIGHHNQKVQLKPQIQDKEIYEIAICEYVHNDAKLISRIANNIKVSIAKDNKAKSMVIGGESYRRATAIFNTLDQEISKSINHNITTQTKLEYGDKAAESFAIQLAEHNLIYGEKTLTTNDVNNFKKIAIEEQKYHRLIEKELTEHAKNDKALSKLIKKEAIGQQLDPRIHISQTDNMVNRLRLAVKSEVRDAIIENNLAPLSISTLHAILNKTHTISRQLAQIHKTLKIEKVK